MYTRRAVDNMHTCTRRIHQYAAQIVRREVQVLGALKLLLPSPGCRELLRCQSGYADIADGIRLKVELGSCYRCFGHLCGYNLAAYAKFPEGWCPEECACKVNMNCEKVDCMF
jgi:hypothetical protein